MRTYVVTNDWQIPFHDATIIDKLFIPFVKWLKPYGMIWNGDMVDCYPLSTFDKDPLLDGSLQKEVDAVAGYMEQLKAIKSIKERVWLGGNHEDRVRRTIWKNISKLPLDADLTFENVYQTKQGGFVYLPYGSVYRLGCLDVTHGSVVRMHSGWTAKAHFEKRGGSVMIGHTHRLGIYYRTNAKGVHAAYENGCMCRLDMEWVQDPDWQQGFSVVHVGDNGFFHVQQLPIINRKVLYYGKESWKI